MNRPHQTSTEWNELSAVWSLPGEKKNFDAPETRNEQRIAIKSDQFTVALAGRFHFDEEAERWDGLS
jgi:hypothetical protein